MKSWGSAALLLGGVFLLLLLIAISPLPFALVFFCVLLCAFLDEPIRSPFFAASLKSAESLFKTADIWSADLYAKKILLQYAAIRAFAPEIVVETGVANGVSSSYLLLALEMNGQGRLYSIEIG